ncbi:MAG: class I poly(R)-hydroxyalkanoic acid synthase [Rubellimicrobium sp.]|nr:class I poly(R)-hydroxyalkanoic acid synthase [Rubellimicrobium sp.]
MTTRDAAEPPRAPDPADGAELAKLEQNIARIEALTQRLVTAMSRKRQVPKALQGPDAELYLKAGTAWMQEMMTNPARLIEHQAEYWGKALKHYLEAQQALAQGTFAAPPDRTPGDRRFANPLWETHPYFNFIKQQYLMNAEAIQKSIAAIEGLDEAERRRLDYFSRQIVDMMSPTNFLATNPDALERAVQTEGQSLVDGLANLVADLERNDGEVVVTLSDPDAFTVGGNLATTPGDVVYRNRMFELIQYRPTTATVHRTPLILFPPWINKFYILDLKPANSLIKWIVDQGFTLFVVSWVNPDATYRETSMTDYVEEGYLTALSEVKRICSVPKVNVIGYCIAGTTLALTLALLARRGDTSIRSATFFTTLTDFSDQGEMAVFLTDDFVDGIEAEVEEAGVLDSFYMSRTFSFLRANDLIYAPAIRSYMMGQSPPAFDLLFWNGDGTNLPGRMAVEYLRGLCQANRFAGEGFEIAGEIVHLADIDFPLCAIACETDHIAGWTASYNGIRAMGSKDKTFILSESGHIAGIVNPPSRQKYGHWTNADLPEDPHDWRKGAQKNEGSWWPCWVNWLGGRSGGMVPARSPGSDAHPVLGPAPGTYVTSRPVD